MTVEPVIFNRWFAGRAPEGTEAAVRHFDDRLQALEQYLGLLADRVEFGPVPGAYLPVFLRVDGAVTVTDPADSVQIGHDSLFGAEIVYVGGVVNAGTSATFNLRAYDYAKTNLGLVLNTALTVSNGSSVHTPGAFALRRFTDIGSMELVVTAIDTSPEDLSVTVLFRQVGRVGQF